MLMRLHNWLNFQKTRLPRVRRSYQSPFAADVSLLESRVMLSAVTWTGHGDGANWSDPKNWSNDSLPTSTSDVTLTAPAGTVIHGPKGATTTINSLTITSAHLMVDNGNLAVTQGVTVGSGQLLAVGASWSSATLSTPTIAVNGGTVVLNGGTIKGATITEGVGGHLASYSGALDGATVNGSLDLSRIDGATLTVKNTLVLNGTMYLGSADGSNAGGLYFGDGSATPTTLSGKATIIFGGSVDNFAINESTGTGSNGTMTVAAGVVICGSSGTFNNAYPTGSIVNQGVISANNASSAGGPMTIGGGHPVGSFVNNGILSAKNWGTLSLDMPWSNTSTITAYAGSTVDLGGSFTTAGMGKVNGFAGTVNITGTDDNTGTTFTVNSSTGNLYLYGGTIENGILAESGGWELIATNGGGTLEGMTVNGNLDLTQLDSAHMSFTNSLVLNGTMLLGAKDGSTAAYISFGDDSGTPVTLSGSATILLGANGLNYISNDTNGTLTFGSTVRIHGGSGTIGNGGNVYSTVINQGSIWAEVNGGSISFVRGTNNLATVQNQGTLSAINGGTLVVDGLAGSLGTVTETATGTIDIDSNVLTTATSTSHFDPEGVVDLTSAYTTAASPQLLEAPSRDLGNTPSAYNNNFAFTTLILDPSSQPYVKLVDQTHNTNSGAPEAVYATTVIVPGGATLDLNGLHLYAYNAIIEGTVINGTITQTPDTGLSYDTIPNQSPAGTFVGNFYPIAPQVDETYAFSLVSGAGSNDNSKFTLTADGTLTANFVANYDTQSIYSIRVRTNISDGSSIDKVFWITILPPEIPVAMTLSNTTVADQSPAGTLVGSLTTFTQDTTDNIVNYSFVNGLGGADNASFAIDANGNLTTTVAVDFDVKNSFSIRVRATDQNNRSFVEVFTITVNSP